MKKPDRLKSLASLLLKPYFTTQEAKNLGVSAALLGHYLKKGYLKRLNRGIYQSSDYKYPQTSFPWDDLIEAVGTVPNGVVCLISALAIYEITEEIPRQHWIAISHGTSINRGPLLKIVRFRNMKLGLSKIEIGSILLPIFDIERTIIDSFRMLSCEVAIKALKMALSYRGKGTKKVDLVKLQAYAKELRFDITPYLLTVTT